MISHNSPNASAICKNFELLRAVIIAKYHVRVMLLFVYNRSRVILGSAQESFDSLQVKKQTQESPFITTFSRQWKKKKKRLTDSCETSTNH